MAEDFDTASIVAGQPASPPIGAGTTDAVDRYTDALRESFSLAHRKEMDVLFVGPLEDMLRGLLRGEHSNLTLTFNDHTANYIDAAKEYADGDMPDDEWISESERDKALGFNQVWTLQWYPDTPVGCHIMRASSLSALLGWVSEHAVGA